MSLSPVGSPPWETIRGVRFAMMRGCMLVPILITRAAIDGMQSATQGSGGHLACFYRHRDAFERIASAKYQRQPLGENGMVVVEAGDLKLITG